MTIDPQLAAIVVTLAIGALIGVPALVRASRSRRRALRACLQCGRTVVFGSRTCDCAE